MTARIVGIDCLSPITPAILAASAKATGQTAAFVGRYFTTMSTPGSGEYHHRIENPVLAARGIRVLPIARQTNHVGGSHGDGFADGRANALDLLATFGASYLQSQGGKFRIFLDVEGSGASRLTPSYYLGWCSGLRLDTGDAEIIPCVYGIPGDNITWAALRTALRSGATCGGIWLSHPFVEVYASTHEPIQWNEGMLKPFAPIEGVDIVAWQYRFAGLYDCNILNPALADASEFLSTLVLPPSPPPKPEVA